MPGLGFVTLKNVYVPAAFVATATGRHGSDGMPYAKQSNDGGLAVLRVTVVAGNFAKALDDKGLFETNSSVKYGVDAEPPGGGANPEGIAFVSVTVITVPAG